jgi:hypothetical protein
MTPAEFEAHRHESPVLAAEIERLLEQLRQAGEREAEKSDAIRALEIVIGDLREQLSQADERDGLQDQKITVLSGALRIAKDAILCYRQSSAVDKQLFHFGATLETIESALSLDEQKVP